MLSVTKPESARQVLLFIRQFYDTAVTTAGIAVSKNWKETKRMWKPTLSNGLLPADVNCPATRADGTEKIPAILKNPRMCSQSPRAPAQRAVVCGRMGPNLGGRNGGCLCYHGWSCRKAFAFVLLSITFEGYTRNGVLNSLTWTQTNAVGSGASNSWPSWINLIETNSRSESRLSAWEMLKLGR